MDELVLDYSSDYRSLLNYSDVQKWMKYYYIVFNALYFDDILPPTNNMIIFEPVIKKAKYLGCAYNTTPYKIRLNFIYDLIELEWKNVLLHEMVHVWQFVMGYSGGHGKSFKMKAKEINKYGWNITTTHQNILEELRYAKEKNR